MVRQARRLNRDGVDQFRIWIMEGAVTPLPSGLLTQSDSSEPMVHGPLLSQQKCDTKLDFARHLVGELSGVEPALIDYDAGFWNWMALFHFDTICPMDENGRRSLLKPWCYLLHSTSLAFARHLCRTPWALYRLYGESSAPVLNGVRRLATAPFQHNDSCEQFVAGGDLFRSSSRFHAAVQLFSDPQRERMLRGSLSSKAPPGSLRRFKQVLQQLGRTYDLDGMGAEAILELLPSEFSTARSA